MERIIRNRSATLLKTFYADGVATDPTGTPTVSVTRSDGTTVTTGAVTNEAAAGTWSVTIPATSNTLLDTLTVAWTGVVNGVAQEYSDIVEVAGDTLFTLAQARSVKPLDDTADYATADIVEMRTTVEDAIEEYCGAFVPRYTVETASGRWFRPLRLRHPFVREIRSISIITAGVTTALTASQLDLITTDGSFLYGYNWPTGHGNVIVGYEHGRDRPPERIRRAALLLAKVWLVAGPVDDRTNTFTSTEGGTYSLVTPGRGGSVFGLPEVDAAVQQNMIPLVA